MGSDYDPAEEQARIWPSKKDRKADAEQKSLDEQVLYNLIQQLTPHQRKILIEFLSCFIWRQPKR